MARQEEMDTGLGILENKISCARNVLLHGISWRTRFCVLLLRFWLYSLVCFLAKLQLECTNLILYSWPWSNPLLFSQLADHQIRHKAQRQSVWRFHFSWSDLLLTISWAMGMASFSPVSLCWLILVWRKYGLRTKRGNTNDTVCIASSSTFSSPDNST